MNETSSVNWGWLLERKPPIAYLSQQLALYLILTFLTKILLKVKNCVNLTFYYHLVIKRRQKRGRDVDLAAFVFAFTTCGS